MTFPRTTREEASKIVERVLSHATARTHLPLCHNNPLFIHLSSAYACTCIHTYNYIYYGVIFLYDKHRKKTTTKKTHTWAGQYMHSLCIYIIQSNSLYSGIISFRHDVMSAGFLVLVQCLSMYSTL